MDVIRKSARFKRILKQLQPLLTETTYALSRMATINAVLHHKMDGFFWTGFYLLKDGELRIGPYQGSLACQILTRNKGVCWAAINQEKTIIVKDVDKFPDHIACDARSRSEIAVPVRDQTGKITGVLDVDSNKIAWFDETDAFYLEEIAAMVYKS